MDIDDAGLIERGSELALGKTGAARGRYRAGIDQEIDPGAFELL
jgi:hypothetical protein